MEHALAPRFPQLLGGFDPRRVPVLTTDVVVIGGGLAGGSAALAAAEGGADVLLLSKTPFEESNTAHAQGGVAATIAEEDSIQLHLDDTLRVGAGLTEPEVARACVAEGRRVVEWLEAMGARFDRDDRGCLALSKEGGHSVGRVVHSNGAATGAEIQRVLRARIEAAPAVRVEEQAFVRDLLVQGGRCVGVVALLGGMELAVAARAVVVATGGAGQVFRETTNPICACGDGMALCFRAGAALADMEFVQFHPTTLYIAGAARFLVSEAVRGAGATLRDRFGERFMVGRHPDAELAPRDVVSRAILERMVETEDTHVYLDMSSIPGDVHEMFPTISRICRAFDIDIAKDPIPVRPGAHYFVGGVRADLHGRTSLSGLFVAGETAATGFHGANRMASNSLLEGAVMGRLAGTAAAGERRRRAPVLSRVAPPPEHENAPRLHLDDLLYSLKSLMGRRVGVTRDADGLQEAIGRIGLWNHYLMRSDPRGRRSWELVNMLTVSALVATAALTRTESRGTHYRSDHPERDDTRWCRHVALERGEDGEIVPRLDPLHAPSDQEVHAPE